MQDGSNNQPLEDSASLAPFEDGSLYALAMTAIKECIVVYLDLTQKTSGFSVVTSDHLKTLAQRVVVLGGINSPLSDEAAVEEVIHEWERMRAVPFDVETAITRGVYTHLRNRAAELIDNLEKATEGFSSFDAAYIVSNPYMLPILQRLANISSKAELKKKIGSASDNSVSKKAAEKLADILNQRQPGRTLNRGQLLQSVEPTLEGIVRDLVGRVILESIVTKALDDASVPYKRESEYRYLEGVIYNFRSDFVIPNESSPKAFIEVRKSSSRHASLYAKDKMFSAINWKGKHKGLLAVLVVDGEWTTETLKILTRIFDYVVPVHSSPDMAKVIAAYLNGDNSKLKWLVEFSVTPALGR